MLGGTEPEEVGPSNRAKSRIWSRLSHYETGHVIGRDGTKFGSKQCEALAAPYGLLRP